MLIEVHFREKNIHLKWFKTSFFIWGDSFRSKFDPAIEIDAKEWKRERIRELIIYTGNEIHWWNCLRPMIITSNNECYWMVIFIMALIVSSLPTQTASGENIEVETYRWESNLVECGSVSQIERERENTMTASTRPWDESDLHSPSSCLISSLSFVSCF